MVMTSDETQIQIFEDWPLSHAKHATPDNKQKYPKYYVVVETADRKNCPAENT